MTDERNSISRRNVLAGLGTIGVGGALVGAGTSALFSDEVTFDDNQLVAGELELVVDWREKYDMGEGYKLIDVFPVDEPGSTTQADLGVGDFCEKYADIENPLTHKKRTIIDYGDTVLDYKGDKNPTKGNETDDEVPLIDLDDIKPGDCWKTTFSFHLCDNPGWIWMFVDAETSFDKPLLEAAEATLWYDNEGNGELSAGDEIISSGSLKDIFELLDGGLLLDGRMDGTKYGHNGNSDETETTCVALEKVDNDNLGSIVDSEVSDIDKLEEGDILEFEDNISIKLTGIEYKNGEDEVIGFDWEVHNPGNLGICRLEMRGGSNVTVEEYECETAGSLTAPKNPAGNQAGLSNFTFSYCENGRDEEKGENGRKPFENSTTQFVTLEWCLPFDAGNDVQGSGLTDFDIRFYTEQARHNDNPDPDHTFGVDD